MLVLASGLVQAAVVGAFTLNDHRGAVVQSEQFADAKCLVVAFLGTECPLAKLYGPRLQALASEFEPQGRSFWQSTRISRTRSPRFRSYGSSTGFSFRS